MSDSNISEVVQYFLNIYALTLREMAEALGVSHPTIINWREGRTEPGTDFLIQLRSSNDGWRREFAEICLQIRLPELFN